MDYTEQLIELRARQERVRPADTPREVAHPLGELTVPEYVDAWARRYPDRLALVHEGRELDYATVADQHARWAGWLSLVVRPGERVAVHLGNEPEFVLAMLGILRAGAVHVPLNPMFLHAELVHELGDAGATVVVTSARLAERLLAAAAVTRVHTVVVVGEGGQAGGPGSASPVAPIPAADLPAAPPGVRVLSWSETLATAPLTAPARDLDALAALNYTGGTTGVPKGCEHTQRHMVYTAVSAAGAAGLGGAGLVAAERGGLVFLCFIPVFWIAGGGPGHPDSPGDGRYLGPVETVGSPGGGGPGGALSGDLHGRDGGELPGDSRRPGRG